MIAHKQLTVDELREQRIKGQKANDEERLLIVSMFQTPGWRLLREDLKARREMLSKKLEYEDFESADFASVVRLQAELRIMDILLAYEKVYT